VCNDTKDSSFWAISKVYGPHSTGERQSLWKELSDYRASFSGIWFVAGDFNLTRFSAERKGLRSHERL